MFRTTLALLALTSITPIALGQETTKEITVEVRRDGKPAPDATVQVLTTKYTVARWLVSSKEPVKVDANGRMKVEFDLRGSPSLIAKDKSGNIGGMNLQHISYDTDDVLQVIDLLPPTTLEGRILDEANQPVLGVKLQLDRVFRIAADKAKRTPSDFFSLESSDAWASTTDAEGKFRIAGLPSGYSVFADCESPKHGHFYFTRQIADRSDIKLPKPGSLKIEIAADAGKVSPKDFHISVLPDPLQSGGFNVPQARGELTEWSTEGISGPILPGNFAASIYPKIQSEFLLEEKEKPNISIKSGEVAIWKVSTIRGAKLIGKVLDKETGQGVAGLSVYYQTGNPRTTYSGKTDAKGNYVVIVPGGAKYDMGFTYSYVVGERKFFPPPYDKTLHQYFPGAIVAPGGQHEFPTITVREARNVVGNVIDAEGKPLTSPTKVYCPIDDSKMRFYQPKFEGNQFTYRGLPYDVPLTFRLRSGKAVNIPERIDPKLLGEQQTFRLSEAHGVKIVGTVLDGKKQGVAGAKVTLSWGYPIQDSDGMSTSTRVEVVKTDAKGAYVFEGWWPKERYFITVEGEGFGKVGEDFNATKTGEPGSTITFDPFLVKPLTLNASGKVQHQDGTPVVGATVQTSGETPKPITATTDAEGRYTLKGLPDMTLFVTVAKPGYRPTYVIHNTSKPELNLSLRRSAEPPSPAPEISAKFLAERKQSLIDILEMLWPKRAEHGYGSLFFADMQRLDPARAKAWAEAATGEEADILKKPLQAQIAGPDLVKLALEDVDEAIARIGKTRGSPDQLRTIAGQIMAKDKAVALRLIEESTILSRKLLAQDPMRLPFNLADCAALAHQAGNVDGAKKLFAEATELVDKIADVKNRDIARSWLAAPLGKVDLVAAKELLAKCEDPYYHNSSVSKILVHLAKTDSQAAIDNLKLLKTDRSRAHFTEKLLIAATIAEREPDNALKLVESIETTVDRVRGYMELARLFAPKDKSKAWGLIDKAFELMEKDPTPFGLYGGSGGVAGAAAQVAYQAKKIDYPDLHSLIARLLMMRKEEGTFTNNDRSKTVLALVLTPIDPVLGRAVLKTMYNDEKLLGPTAPGDRDILFVLAMSDPAMCKKVVEMKLSKVKNSENMMRTGISEMLSGMSVPGREIESLSPYASGMYRPLSEER